MKETHEITHQVLMLGDLLKKVWAGRLRIGAFDSGRADTHETEILLDSVRRSIPMGTITVWNTNEDHEIHKERNTSPQRLRPNGSVWYAIDGAQRLERLAEMLTPPAAATKLNGGAERAYVNVASNRITVTEGNPSSPGLLPLNCLFDTGSYLREIAGMTKADLDNADIIASTFRDYQIQVTELTNCTRKIIDLIRERKTLRA